ncbi:MAG: nuclear transport factor 2 family protein [Nitrospiraceae bacterium]
MRLIFVSWGWLGIMIVAGLPAHIARADNTLSPEATIRAVVRANAEKDLATLSRLMAHDSDIVSYTFGGRKYVGWTEFVKDMQEEFDSVARLDIPITELTVWSRHDIAWFVMELDYIRYIGQGNDQSRSTLPLRETGVLERRDGQWILLSWHESFRGVSLEGPTAAAHAVSTQQNSAESTFTSTMPDLSGEWDILEVEEDKTYKATLDSRGNGPYTQQGGRFVTTKFSDRLWHGSWHQTGNDREGEFELLLSEDGTWAEGVWWYTRVGNRSNIPPRQHGGKYRWKRLTPLPPTTH